MDAIPSGSWVNIDVATSGGAEGSRDAIYAARDGHPNQPVGVRLAPGTYAHTLGGEIWLQRVLRTATSPIWIVATNPAPSATVIGHGSDAIGLAYVASWGLTIGPATVGAWNGSPHANPRPLQAQAGIHVAGAAIAGGTRARRSNGALDRAIYGEYEPSHHIVVRGLTIQDLFDPAAENAVLDEGQSMVGRPRAEDRARGRASAP